MKEKVALMTIWQVNNYGSVLQTLATQIIIQKLGYECDVINYRFPNKWHYDKGYKIPSIITKIKSVLLKRIRFFKSPAYAVAQFRRRNLNFTKRFNSLVDLESYQWNKYKALVSGSDQVWNPNALLGDKAFMLSFASSKCKKISISSSFAVDWLPENLVDRYVKYISKFSNISVRESNAQNIIKNQLKLNVSPHLMLDPTLLVSSEEWEKYMNIIVPKREKKYLLLYALDYAFEPRPLIIDVAAKLKTQLGCDEIITFSDANSKETLQLNAKSVKGASVEDFLNYFKYATVIVTSSFHGTAFAVNFGRPLLAVTPGSADDRQRSLLRILKIEECARSVKEECGDLNPFYDVPRVQKELKVLRKTDLNWIEEALRD